MSGVPNLDGIDAACGALVELRDLDQKIKKLSAQILSDQNDRGAAIMRRDTVISDAWKELEKMDVVQSGNNGFKNRLLSLLTELAVKRSGQS